MTIENSAALRIRKWVWRFFGFSSVYRFFSHRQKSAHRTTDRPDQTYNRHTAGKHIACAIFGIYLRSFARARHSLLFAGVRVDALHVLHQHAKMNITLPKIYVNDTIICLHFGIWLALHSFTHFRHSAGCCFSFFVLRSGRRMHFVVERERTREDALLHSCD